MMEIAPEELAAAAIELRELISRARAVESIDPYIDGNSFRRVGKGQLEYVGVQYIPEVEELFSILAKNPLLNVDKDLDLAHSVYDRDDNFESATLSEMRNFLEVLVRME